MSCPDSGSWRAWLDGEPDGQRPDLADHLESCPACRETVAELRDESALVASAIGALAPASLPSPAATALARQRLAGRRTAELPQVRPLEAIAGRPRIGLGATFRHWRLALAGLAAALLLVVLVATPAGQTAAAQFLAQFRSQRFTVVTVDPGQARNPYKELEHLGTVSGVPERLPREEVKSVAEASQRVGFAVKQPDPATLPADLKAPRIAVVAASQPRFTFQRAKAQAYFQSIGRSDVAIPDKFDGATLVAGLPAGAMLIYNRESDGEYGLVIGQFNQVTAGTEGKVTLEELRDFLLSLPGLPPDTMAQLRAIQDWRNTLPLPVPADRVRWQDTRVAGGPGLVLVDTAGLGNGVIWQRDGRVYGVAGSFKLDEIKRVADSLR